MGKLVRDLIPEIIRATGRAPAVRVLDAQGYENALHDKLLEEAAELRQATTHDERLTEAADVLEVLRALSIFSGFTLDDVIRAAEQKRIERGGFTDRLWLEHS
ncbi:nucleoside triphosphate pyrophosphohydrolase [Nocardia sp. NPDC052278]|uniref:nucleoside triphosphate pyrophosphohydrolase n=1 Tax=unclassified Nocardia TaxID=2637762 RepID=UPI0036B445EB